MFNLIGLFHYSFTALQTATSIRSISSLFSLCYLVHRCIICRRAIFISRRVTTKMLGNNLTITSTTMLNCIDWESVPVVWNTIIFSNMASEAIFKNVFKETKVKACLNRHLLADIFAITNERLFYYKDSGMNRITQHSESEVKWDYAWIRNKWVEPSSKRNH